MLLPGPEAQQLATYIGWLMHRSWGGIVAGRLFVLPSLFILIALSWVYIAFGQLPLVAGGHDAAQPGFGPALIDDDSPTPVHARFSRERLVRVLVVGLALWGAAMGCLLATVGANGTLAQMGWFFTKAALLTFGGPYAVLPYVYQGAVEHCRARR